MADERIIMASTFKAKCLALIDQVAVDHVPLVITKRGRPVARVVPIEPAAPQRSTDRSVTILVDDDEALFGTGSEWDVLG